ncbi:glycosyltransferase [Candidatus Daviesbacteria bacterium]|nr:glycosyltransferase [Candidatus Daviesbacteria bacterium]
MKKYTVTVAVSVFNEEANILNFMKSVIKQQEEYYFSFKKFLIISDGSTDKTVTLAKKIKNRKIEIIDYKIRTGKSSRLNEIYSKLNTDFLVQTDADVVFKDEYVIKNMILPLILDKKTGMCTGNPLPLPGKTFTEKADVAMLNVYWPILKNHSGGNNVFSADGRILSYKKELVKNIIVPEDMIANDFYTYFYCIHKGYKCKFIKKAVVNFRASQNIKDKVKQNLRSAAIPLRMLRYFPNELVHEQMRIPLWVRMECILSQFSRNPIYSVYIYFINKYCEIKARSAERHLNAKWEIALTSKKLN